MNYNLVNEATQARQGIVSSMENIINQNMKDLKFDKKSIIEFFKSKSIDFYKISMFELGIKEIIKLMKLKSKPLACLLKEFLGEYEKSICESLNSLSIKFQASVNKINDGFIEMKQKVEGLISENDFLSKQLIDYKNRLATEQAEREC